MMLSDLFILPANCIYIEWVDPAYEIKGKVTPISPLIKALAIRAPPIYAATFTALNGYPTLPSYLTSFI
jgi:hypothetical protein